MILPGSPDGWLRSIHLAQNLSNDSPANENHTKFEEVFSDGADNLDFQSILLTTSFSKDEVIKSVFTIESNFEYWNNDTDGFS